MSRPRIHPKDERIGLCVQLSHKEYDKISALAHKRRTSMAAVVRSALHTASMIWKEGGMDGL